MTADLPVHRAALLDAARRLDDAGLNVNASGNLSVRVGPHVLVTPSGIPPAVMAEADMVLLDADGEVVEGDRTPTSEWRLHAALMAARPEVGAIVHTHSPEATAAATLRAAVPAVHYVAARFGGRGGLACADYATYGSAELAGNVAAALGGDRTACLMANHGAVAVAGGLDAALALALDVEWFCGVHRRARALGDPVALDDEEIARVATRFAAYGQPVHSR
ncbi:class II aldolase/adducin family protein [Euzebya sp.]|uniref:class II aldolase/adducin family protein n=1 Tax=Euzebya sp. TaxID=1971409 RepID=UPI003517C875